MDGPAPIRFVLDHPSHPGNIGAAARAMKVMGLSDLHLVAPAQFPSAEATARASSADDVLHRASVHAALDDALAGCVWVIGTSHRAKHVEQPLLEPREAASRALEQPGPVAVLFGCERSGLDNAAMDRCHALVQIPTGPDYTSLNLAQAVQILAYEVHLAMREGRVEPERSARPPATAERLAVFFQRLEATLRAIRFSTPGQDEMLHRRLRRVFMRARPDDDELNMLNGMLSRTLATARHRDRNERDADRE
ncbi:RNA methyltransferase [Wenzhouxiangella sp. XN79A]|uniref:RNA methyltransferase n=1 Tax=Wenzhouxiangella sp. XN79A TaxID=2724193 RepID=UPI00144A8C17|nr:RNA methyltransferase [Wenzhouxiangella sp. XN79A]NKI33737.1 RNA methyltransferase [Wenzhouxiangella sp. XN79A]